MERSHVIEYLANRRWEQALDPDMDGDNDSPGSGADPDNDPVASNGPSIIGHLSQAQHHVRQMQKAHEAHNSGKVRHHHAAAQSHMAAASKMAGGY